MNLRGSIVLVVLAAIGLLLIVWTCGAEDPVPSATDLVILYSGNLEGELEPCGCTEGQLGGLARRATWIREARRRGENILLVDAGDLYFRREPIPDLLKPQLRLKAQTIVGIYRALDYRPAALGELDLVLGCAAFEQLQRPPLAANLRGTIHTESTSVIEVDRCRVGLFGLASHLREDAGGIEVVDARETASRAVADLRERADLVICLSHLGWTEDRGLAESVPGLDIIAGGHDGTMLESPLRVGRTLVLQAGSRGRFLGQLTLHLRPDWRAGDLFDASENEKWKKNAVEYDAVVERFTRERDAATTPGDRERAQARIDQYRKEAVDARARIRDLSGRSWFSNRLVRLDKGVPDDPDVAAAVETYKRQVRELNERIAEAAAAAPKEGPAFVGGASCVECHAEEHESWAKSPHASAFATLVRREQEFDLECIGCHTTAFQEKGGFFAPTRAGGWKGVQCEACHGPGEGHPPRKLVRLPGRAVCTLCHQPPQHDGFDFERSLPLTRHGK